MTEDQKETERRGFIRTIVDPKTFPTLIPILLAIASAFMVHDRAISTMQVMLDQHDRVIGKNSDRAELIANFRGSLALLEQRIDDIDSDIDGFHESRAECRQTIALLKQSVKIDEFALNKLEEQVRQLELIVSKAH